MEQWHGMVNGGGSRHMQASPSVSGRAGGVAAGPGGAGGSARFLIILDFLYQIYEVILY